MKKTQPTADRVEAHLPSIVLDTEKHGDAFIALIQTGGYVPLRITGASMSPLLRPNRDTVWLKAYDPDKTGVGQILLFRRSDGAFVLHRVRKCLPDGTLKMNGDAQSWCEIIPRDSVIAAAEEITVRGKTDVLPRVSDPGMEFSVVPHPYLPPCPLPAVCFHKKLLFEALISGTAMNNATDLTVSLLRKELTNDPAVLLPETVGEEELVRVFQISSRHDLAHITGTALKKAGLGGTGDVMKPFNRHCYLAFYRYEYIRYEIERTCAALEEENIPHLLLKGAHLRSYYPSPEMRTSSDIDLLVKPSDLDHAVRILTEKIGYTNVRRGSHDVLLITPNHIQFELHYTLTDTENSSPDRQFLSRVWENAVRLENSRCGYVMSPEMLVLYHISHMVKHFTAKGCGIRFFMDLWILNHCAPAFDKTRVTEMLSACGYLKFYDAACHLAEVWFSGAEHTELTEKLSRIIVAGGVYGSTQNQILLKKSKTNRFSYFFSRMFLPYKVLKYQYPVLQKFPFLLPFCEIHRWFRLFSQTTAKRIRNELTIHHALTPEMQDQIRVLMDQLGLSV